MLAASVVLEGQPLAPLERPAGSDAAARVGAAYDRLREAWRRAPHPDYEWRRDALARLGATVRRRSSEIVAAAAADFGGRSEWTTKIGDLATTLGDIDYLARNLRRFMAPERRRVALHFRPARAEVRRQPLGVVAVIAPWNYPFRLALGPLAAAIAAGNRVILKPSELAPRSAELLAELSSEALSDERVAVVLGGPDVAEAVTRLPLDHLCFTGSSRVGRRVMRAASEHLTPLTLELGGKCPVIVHPSASLERMARRVVAGKLFNAGQTCMAPDHVWVHESQVGQARVALRAEIARQYPTLVGNPDYTAIINAQHERRLEALLKDALGKGAHVEVVNPALEPFEGTGKAAPVLLWAVSPGMAIASEEIFGPLLPIRGYQDLDTLFRTLLEEPSPLAAYYFDPEPRRFPAFLHATRSGGACINDVVLQSVQEDLPFGGVGESGMGRYHGREGFETFSHPRAVFQQARWTLTELFIPPYGKWAKAVIDWLAS